MVVTDKTKREDLSSSRTLIYGIVPLIEIGQKVAENQGAIRTFGW
jgi:hypothetical protein